MTSRRLGCAVVTVERRVAGIITDGDLRRMLRSYTSLDGLTAANVMTPNPKTVMADEFAVAALHIMHRSAITQLVVTDSEGRYLGVVHMHDIIREGII